MVLSCVEMSAGALTMVSLATLFYGGMHTSSGAWQLATKAGGNSEQAADVKEHVTLTWPAIHQISAMNNE
jgi:hypothetical protein